MDELQERYDELDNIEITLKALANEVKDEKYREQLWQIMFDAQEEKKQIEPRLQEMYDAEEKEQEREYWNSQF